MIIVLSGPVGGGKTTLIETSLNRWTSRGLRYSGFLSLAVADRPGQTEYDLLDLKEGRRLPFLRRTGEPEWERVGPFFFLPRTLDVARSLILAADPSELLIVDEVGPLELGGGGLWPALKEVLFKPPIRSLLVIRETILEDFVGRLGQPVPLVFDVSDPNIRLLLDGSLFGTRRLDDGQG
jgi:nucleoside-triphosphatase THEP1